MQEDMSGGLSEHWGSDALKPQPVLFSESEAKYLFSSRTHTEQQHKRRKQSNFCSGGHFLIQRNEYRNEKASAKCNR